MRDLRVYLSAADLARVRRMVDDLDRLEAGWRPTADDLRDAPVLSDWHRAVVIAPEPVLTGRVTSHPAIGAGREVATSRIVALDGAELWARTVSRFYRLGRSADDQGGIQ